MEEVRNAENKLICKIDKQKKVVEIVLKGCKTTICFSDNGTAEIVNTQTK